MHVRALDDHFAREKKDNDFNDDEPDKEMLETEWHDRRHVA